LSLFLSASGQDFQGQTKVRAAHSGTNSLETTALELFGNILFPHDSIHEQFQNWLHGEEWMQ
jgi:hypothetical protein